MGHAYSVMKPLHDAGTKNDHPMGALASKDFLPGECHHIEFGKIQILREGGRGRIANRQTLPVRRNPFGIGNPHT